MVNASVCGTEDRRFESDYPPSSETVLMYQGGFLVYIRVGGSDGMKIQNIWFEFEEWANGYNETDENSDVHFELEDGSKWCASFFTYQNLLSLARKNQQTGEHLSGQYFYTDKPIFIAKMEKELIISVLSDIIQHEQDLSSIFTKIDN